MMVEPSTIHNERGKEALREIFKPYEDKPVSLRDLDCALYEIFVKLSWYFNRTDSAILQMSTVIEFMESGAAPLEFVQNLAGLWGKPVPDEPYDTEYMKIAQHIYEKSVLKTDEYGTAQAYAVGRTIDAAKEHFTDAIGLAIGHTPAFCSSRNRLEFNDYEDLTGRIDDTFQSLTDKVSSACGNFAEAAIRLKPLAEYVGTGLASDIFVSTVCKDMNESDLSHLANVIADCDRSHVMAPVLKLTESFSLTAGEGKEKEASDERAEHEAAKEQGQGQEYNAIAHRKGR